MTALHILLPGPRWDGSGWLIAGGCFLLVGIILNLMSARLFSQRQTTIKPFERSEFLVVGGPYRYSRNPMYVGMLLMLVGIGLLLSSTTPWLIIPAFVWLISARFISAEEQMLAERFGVAYQDYCQRVRRWL